MSVQLNNQTIVHVWKSNPQSELTRVTEKGHRVIFSSPWYLNYIQYGNDWTDYYGQDPQNFSGAKFHFGQHNCWMTGTPDQKKLVLGGEACMWGEFVDGSNVISRTWPRASSVAERLWSDATVTDLSGAESRLETHRCRMLK
ncbi:HEXB [Cordylochernes scorpioides]|uniref:beta-N-acetylhexosaminidase n=1 Tax=Cordylochernes scorpioides TaxID=51811 RepID=A0ABY6K925_9ARAC|nr:HEXB [Cordylochernes scorpioides]